MVWSNTIGRASERGRNDDDVDVIEKRIDVDVTHEVDSRGETETRGLSS